MQRRMLKISIKIKLKKPTINIKNADVQYDIQKFRTEHILFEKTIVKIIQNHNHNINNWGELTNKLKTAFVFKFHKINNNQKHTNKTHEDLRKYEKEANYKIYGNVLNVNQHLNKRILIKYMKTWEEQIKNNQRDIKIKYDTKTIDVNNQINKLNKNKSWLRNTLKIKKQNTAMKLKTQKKKASWLHTNNK